MSSTHQQLRKSHAHLQDVSWPTALIVCVFALLVATWPTASAAKDAESAQVVQEAEPERHALWGVVTDVGLPDGVGVSALVRPLRWLRVQAGATTTGVGFGMRGGVTFVPFHYWISPTVALEGGHVFPSNMNRLTGMFGFETSELERFSYSYGTAHAGLQLGSPNGFMFFVHAGVSYVRASLAAVEQAELSDDPGQQVSVSANAPKVTYFGPTAKMGLLLHL